MTAPRPCWCQEEWYTPDVGQTCCISGALLPMEDRYVFERMSGERKSQAIERHKALLEEPADGEQITIDDAVQS